MIKLLEIPEETTTMLKQQKCETHFSHLGHRGVVEIIVHFVPHNITQKVPTLNYTLLHL